MGASTRATGACVVIQCEHAIEKIGDARRIGRGGGRRRSGKRGGRRRGCGTRFAGLGCSHGGEQTRREQLGEYAGIGHAGGFALENLVQVLVVDAGWTIALSHGFQRVHERLLKHGGVESGAFVGEADLPAATGELQARKIRGDGRCGKNGGQNSAR
mgnify:CR=1 FL=1